MAVTIGGFSSLSVHRSSNLLSYFGLSGLESRQCGVMLLLFVWWERQGYCGDRVFEPLEELGGGAHGLDCAVFSKEVKR